jgi:hypothetical protein
LWRKRSSSKRNGQQEANDAHGDNEAMIGNEGVEALHCRYFQSQRFDLSRGHSAACTVMSEYRILKSLPKRNGFLTLHRLF